MAKKQFSKKKQPVKSKQPKTEKAPPEDSKIKPLDPPPPPGAGDGTPGIGDENQAT